MRDTPCPKCGWKEAGFHLCLFDMRDEHTLKVATTEEHVEKPKRKSRARPGANRSESVKRARANEPGRREREEEILRLYDMHHSMTGIAKILHIDFRTVQRVVKEAIAAGKAEDRPNPGNSRRAVA